MDFKTQMLKSGIILQQLLTSKIVNESCYVLLTTGQIIQFICPNNDDAKKIQSQLNSSLFNINSFKIMEFVFEIVVHENQTSI